MHMGIAGGFCFGAVCLLMAFFTSTFLNLDYSLNHTLSLTAEQSAMKMPAWVNL